MSAAERDRLADRAVAGTTTPLTRLPDPRERPWLSVAELAAITGEGEKAIRSAIDAGQIPHLMVGRYVRIPTAHLLAAVGIDSTAADPDSTPGLRLVDHDPPA